MEKIGQILYDFEEKHPILANIIGVALIYIIGLLLTLVVILKVLR